MFDPSAIPDVTPITTTIPWLDAVLKILGAIGVLLTIAGNVLPKFWPVTQVIAKMSPDFRGAVPQAAAKAEAIAQSQGTTTVPQDILPSNLPMATKASLKPPPTP